MAYCLDRDFLRRLRQFTDALKPDFFLVGETLHGDYNQWVGDGLLHSCTNGETMLLRVRFIAEFICTEI